MFDPRRVDLAKLQSASERHRIERAQIYAVNCIVGALEIERAGIEQQMVPASKLDCGIGVVNDLRRHMGKP